LRVSSADARPADAVALRARRDASRWVNQALWRAAMLRGAPRPDAGHTRNPDLARWNLVQGGVQVDGGLVLDLSSSLDAFRPARSSGDFTLYRYERALGRFHGAERVVVAEDDARSLHLVMDPSFDPEREVVLSAADEASVPAELRASDQREPCATS